jgi:hypothetical protein
MNCKFCGGDATSRNCSFTSAEALQSNSNALKHFVNLDSRLIKIPDIKAPNIKELMLYGWSYEISHEFGKFRLQVRLFPAVGAYSSGPKREDGYYPFYIKTEIDDPAEAQRRFVTIATDIHVACKKLELSTEASEKRQKQLFAEYQKNLEYEKATLRQYQEDIDRQMKDYIKAQENRS